MRTRAVFLHAVLGLACATVLGQPLTPVPPDREETFLRQAIVAGLMQIEMGRLAAQRSANREIAAYGEMMLGENSIANAELKKAGARRKLKFPSELDDAQRKDLDAARRMRGPGFDRSFVEHMVSAQREAIATYQRFAAEAANGELRALAQRMLPRLQANLERIEAIQTSQEWEAAGKRKRLQSVPLAMGPETKLL